jgi:hypothetical protein
VVPVPEAGLKHVHASWRRRRPCILLAGAPRAAMMSGTILQAEGAERGGIALEGQRPLAQGHVLHGMTALLKSAHMQPGVELQRSAHAAPETPAQTTERVVDNQRQSNRSTIRGSNCLQF